MIIDIVHIYTENGAVSPFHWKPDRIAKRLYIRAVAGADDYRIVEANINGLQYLSARVTARSAGEVTVVCRLFND